MTLLWKEKETGGKKLLWPIILAFWDLGCGGEAGVPQVQGQSGGEAKVLQL